jgi:hypothetical protein
MRTTGYITAILFLATTSLAQSSYIGYTYNGTTPGETLSNGVTYLGGGIVGDVYERTPVGVSDVKRGRTRMLWLERSTGRDTVGRTNWRVIDVLSFSDLKANDYLFSGSLSECTRHGKEMPSLVGLGKVNNKTGRIKPIRLWLPHLKTGRFVKTSIADVKCMVPTA